MKPKSYESSLALALLFMIYGQLAPDLSSKLGSAFFSLCWIVITGVRFFRKD